MKRDDRVRLVGLMKNSEALRSKSVPFMASRLNVSGTNLLLNETKTTSKANEDCRMTETRVVNVRRSHTA